MDAITLLSFLIVSSFAIVASSVHPSFHQYGVASVNHSTILVTQSTKLCTSKSRFPNSGTVIYKNPIEISRSFTTGFSFSVLTPPSPCLSGDGFSFFINTGFPVYSSHQESNFFAVEFKDGFDKSFAAVNDNGAVLSAMIDVNLFTGKLINCWIHYDSTRKIVHIWVGYPGVTLHAPVLSAMVDLPERFHGAPVYFGFTAHGSSVHLIKKWELKTFTPESDSGSESIYPDFQTLDFGSGPCLVCFPQYLPPIQIQPVVHSFWFGFYFLMVIYGITMIFLWLPNVGPMPRVRL